MFPMQTVMLAVVCCSCVLLTPGVDVSREKLQVIVVLLCSTPFLLSGCVLAEPLVLCVAKLLVLCRLCSSSTPGVSKTKAWRRLATSGCPCFALRLHSRHVQYGSLHAALLHLSRHHLMTILEVHSFACRPSIGPELFIKKGWACCLPGAPVCEQVQSVSLCRTASPW